jgi:hypothetical protein
METSSSVYTWETGQDTGEGEDEDDEEEAKTVPTTAAAWSPQQTPKQGSSRHTTPVIGSGLAARGVFEKEAGGAGAVVGGGGLGVVDGSVGVNVNAHRPLSVGVAF